MSGDVADRAWVRASADVSRRVRRRRLRGWLAMSAVRAVVFGGVAAALDPAWLWYALLVWCVFTLGHLLRTLEAS